jgi:hypothetical protein
VAGRAAASIVGDTQGRSPAAEQVGKFFQETAMPTISGFSKAIQSAIIPGGPVGAFNVPGDLQPSDTLLSVLHITDGSPATAVERKASSPSRRARRTRSPTPPRSPREAFST